MARSTDIAEMVSRAGLTRRQVRCVVLYFIDCRTQAEVAQLLRMPQQTVSWDLAQAQLKMAAIGKTLKRASSPKPTQSRMVLKDPAQMDHLGPKDIKVVW